MKSDDILNTYMQAPAKEKVWTMLGPEFGKDTRMTAVIVRSSYGLKSVGVAFRYHLAGCMDSMQYKFCKADSDLWLKSEIKL